MKQNSSSAAGSVVAPSREIRLTRSAVIMRVPTVGSLCVAFRWMTKDQAQRLRAELEAGWGLASFSTIAPGGELEIGDGGRRWAKVVRLVHRSGAVWQCAALGDGYAPTLARIVGGTWGDGRPLPRSVRYEVVLCGWAGLLESGHWREEEVQR